MDVVADANEASDIACADKIEPDFGFLPNSLLAQCRSLIESYHELHGFACLPDILWKARLGPFIEAHGDLRQLLRKASTSRSAKKSNAGFVRIATTLLSLEILASRFAGWSTIYPQAASRARAILMRNARGPHMPLMEFYLHPPKHISSAAIATLTLPANHQPGKAEPYHASKPELAGDKMAPDHLDTLQHPLDGTSPRPTAAPST